MAYTFATLAPVLLAYLTCLWVEAQLQSSSPYAGRVLVTWAHHRDAVRTNSTDTSKPLDHSTQDENLQFFLRVGFGINTTAFHAPIDTRLHIVLPSPDAPACPVCHNAMRCVTLYMNSHGNLMSNVQNRKRQVRVLTPAQPLASHLEAFALSAHHAPYAQSKRRPQPSPTNTTRSDVKYLIFLDGSARGPFVPHYMPATWMWTRAFVEHLTPNGGIVSTAVQCLPNGDPSLQTWAWGASRGALHLLLAEGVLQREGAEVAIMRTILNSGLPATSLLYSHGVWRSADGVCDAGPGPAWGNPYETVFVQPGRGGLLTQKYSAWRMAEAGGAFNTEGEEDPLMYRFAIR